jgi:hypothetical protein
MLRAVVARSAVAGHAHVVRRRGSRAVGSANTRVVLRSTPAETDTGVTDRVALHLVDGHLGSMAVDELDETAALARWYLDIGDFAEALEEWSKLVLGDVAGKTTDKDGGVVGISELVHLGSRVETSVREALHTTAVPHLLLGHAGHHRTTMLGSLATEAVVATVLGGSSRDSHGSVTAVDSLHLNESALLVVLVREANETVAAALTAHGIGHDLGRLARGETSLEERNQDVLVDFGAKVTHENAVLGAAIIPSVDKTTTGSPVELERASAVGDCGAVHAKGLGSRLRALELDETVAGVTRVLVADDLNVHIFMSRRQEDALDEVLVHPRFELTHPEGGLGRVRARSRGRGNAAHIRGGRSAVGVGHRARRGTIVGRDTRETRVHIHDGRWERSKSLNVQNAKDAAELDRAEQQKRRG